MCHLETVCEGSDRPLFWWVRWGEREIAGVPLVLGKEEDL